MLATYELIDALRRELRDCHLTGAERAKAHATLALLCAEQAALSAAFEADLATYALPD